LILCSWSICFFSSIKQVFAFCNAHCICGTFIEPTPQFNDACGVTFDISVNTSCDVLKFGIKYGNVMIVGSAVLVSSADDDQSKQYGSIAMGSTLVFY
jgi:hypothetical protein